MRFSVIYDADIPMDVSVKCVQPPRVRRWQLTERSDGGPSDWCSDLWDGKAKHRKWCAILTKEQMREFCNHVNLYADSTETMGSIGAPGFGIGWAPAIAFNGADGNDGIQSAYVTPMPSKPNGDPIKPNGATERDWKRIKKAILKMFS